MKWLHNLLKGVSLSGALFVFQACYGAPPVDTDELIEEEAAMVATKAPEAAEVEGQEAEAETPVVEAEAE